MKREFVYQALDDGTMGVDVVYHYRQPLSDEKDLPVAQKITTTPCPHFSQEDADMMIDKMVSLFTKTDLMMRHLSTLESIDYDKAPIVESFLGLYQFVVRTYRGVLFLSRLGVRWCFGSWKPHAFLAVIAKELFGDGLVQEDDDGPLPPYLPSEKEQKEIGKTITEVSEEMGSTYGRELVAHGNLDAIPVRHEFYEEDEDDPFAHVGSDDGSQPFMTLYDQGSEYFLPGEMDLCYDAPLTLYVLLGVQRDFYFPFFGHPGEIQRRIGEWKGKPVSLLIYGLVPWSLFVRNNPHYPVGLIVRYDSDPRWFSSIRSRVWNRPCMLFSFVGGSPNQNVNLHLVRSGACTPEMFSLMRWLYPAGSDGDVSDLSGECVRILLRDCYRYGSLHVLDTESDLLKEDHVSDWCVYQFGSGMVWGGKDFTSFKLFMQSRKKCAFLVKGAGRERRLLKLCGIDPGLVFFGNYFSGIFDVDHYIKEWWRSEGKARKHKARDGVAQVVTLVSTLAFDGIVLEPVEGRRLPLRALVPINYPADSPHPFTMNGVKVVCLPMSYSPDFPSCDYLQPDYDPPYIKDSREWEWKRPPRPRTLCELDRSIRGAVKTWVFSQHSLSVALHKPIKLLQFRHLYDKIGALSTGVPYSIAWLAKQMRMSPWELWGYLESFSVFEYSHVTDEVRNVVHIKREECPFGAVYPIEDG